MCVGGRGGGCCSAVGHLKAGVGDRTEVAVGRKIRGWCSRMLGQGEVRGLTRTC